MKGSGREIKARTFALEHNRDRVGRILGLQRHHVVVAGALKHLRERGQIHAERDSSVCAVVLKHLLLHHQRD
jgi:hypothetical protein